MYFLSLINDGTEESYFPAITSFFESSQGQLTGESNILWNTASARAAHASFEQHGTAA